MATRSVAYNCKTVFTLRATANAVYDSRRFRSHDFDALLSPGARSASTEGSLFLSPGQALTALSSIPNNGSAGH